MAARSFSRFRKAFGYARRFAQGIAGLAKGNFSVGALKAALGGGTPGSWQNDHREECLHFTGWNYIAIHAICMQLARCKVEIVEKIDEQAKQPNVTSGGFAKAEYRAKHKEDNVLGADHPLARFLARPSRKQNGAMFRYRRGLQLELTGTQLIWNSPNKLGKTVEMFVLPTALAEPIRPNAEYPAGAYRMTPQIIPGGWDEGWMDITGYEGAMGLIIPAEQISALRMPHPLFTGDGYSSTSACARWTDIAEMIDTSRWSHMKSGPNQSVIVEVEEEDPHELTVAEEKFNKKYGGAQNTGKAIFISGSNGQKVSGLRSTAVEMDYGQAFLQTRDSCLAMRQTPPVAVGILDGGSYAAFYASLKQHIVLKIQPMLDLMAEEDTENIARQFGSNLLIRYTAAAIDDPILFEQQLNTDILAGAMTRDEYRAMRGLPPLEDAEKGAQLIGKISEVAKSQEGGDLANDAQSGGMPSAVKTFAGTNGHTHWPRFNGDDRISKIEESVEKLADTVTMAFSQMKLMGLFNRPAVDLEHRMSAIEKAWDETEPRVPAGSEGGGEWTSGGAGSRGAGGAATPDKGKKGPMSTAIAAQDYKKLGTKAPAFKAWFGDWENEPAKASKVRDAKGKPVKQVHTHSVVEKNGKPLVVYHGTKANFDAFDKSKISKLDAWQGFYFAEAEKHSSIYGIVKKVYLNIRNPIMLDTAEGKAAYDAIYKEAKGNAFKVGKLIKKRGYDGIKVVHAGQKPFWIAFAPEQIKSAENRGTFDPDDANITKTWDESKHPRGQPENAGEFGPGGGTATAKKPTTGKKPKTAAADKAPKVYVEPGSEKNLEYLFGERTTPENIAAMAGAQPGSSVSIRADMNGAQVSIQHKDYYAVRKIYKDHIYNDLIMVKKKGYGLGTKIFSDQVEAAAAAGMKYIECEAFRSGGGQEGQAMNGYYTWARLGYDAALGNKSLTAKIRDYAKHTGAKKISDLMKTQEGRDLWKTDGVTREMQFDLSKGSLSRKVLKAYVTARAAA